MLRNTVLRDTGLTEIQLRNQENLKVLSLFGLRVG